MGKKKTEIKIKKRKGYNREEKKIKSQQSQYIRTKQNKKKKKRNKQQNKIKQNKINKPKKKK